jgi:amino-acid N-acetyltransferase
MSAIRIRGARPADVPAIAMLVNGFAEERVMLPRSLDSVAMALDDYVVGVDERGRVLACGALREYSPSVAEVASIAVARDRQGEGIGRAIVERVHALAVMRGYREVFLVTVTPAFFEALGYSTVPRHAYPEKQCAHALSMAACDVCEKVCMRRSLGAALERAA